MNIFERAEDFGLAIQRRITTAWLRIRFATGDWRGVMLHADRGGNLGRSVRLEGLLFTESSPEYRITRDGEDLIVLNKSRVLH